MRNPALPFALCLLAGSAGLAGAQQVSPDQTLSTAPTASSETAATVSPQEQLIRNQVAAFVKAFNAADATALGTLFAEDAVVVNSDGQNIQGREAIVAQFQAAFDARKDATISVEPESVKFLGDSVAIERGIAVLEVPDGRAPERSQYTVVYHQKDGQWLQTLVEEVTLEATTAAEHLQELAWLIGEWIDESDEGLVRFSCGWDDNQAFLVRNFVLEIGGQPVMTGTQRIGWDPQILQFRSWVFDSEGGFAEGTWSRDGDRWVIKTSGVLSDGSVATATHLVARTGQDSLTWASVDRTNGGEVVPDLPAVTLVRKPPPPQ